MILRAEANPLSSLIIAAYRMDLQCKSYIICSRVSLVWLCNLCSIRKTFERLIEGAHHYRRRLLKGIARKVKISKITKALKVSKMRKVRFRAAHVCGSSKQLTVTSGYLYSNYPLEYPASFFLLQIMMLEFVSSKLFPVFLVISSHRFQLARQVPSHFQRMPVKRFPERAFHNAQLLV